MDLSNIDLIRSDFSVPICPNPRPATQLRHLGITAKYGVFATSFNNLVCM